MAEYIEREALISDLEDLHEQERIKYMGVYDCIKSQPTADVQKVKHGKWKKNGNGRDCSECDFKYYANGGLFNYCPKCGAKMDK